ncbi:hypothetical protein [Mycolicibacterium psychrotolerans]|uniref:PASTA domain-containing protein n=1 Tax=Mycolicibacterium psychrotolerans TaxID=216929 RepID=A0A7I7M6W2_9MYCO|nr:hypothetical protein [Mycolicibacterium psychrotolerans]BBX67925.1 hypothetical protein MPSYJ_13860 [Mycolicibacterium psychrotolerans]
MPARCVLLVAAAFVALALAPPGAAEPGSGSAAAVIDDLEGQGYDVQINWVSGVSSRPLGECQVLGVHNPDLTGPPPETFTTVYVDVSCPNHDDDVSVNGGIGIGIGF